MKDSIAEMKKNTRGREGKAPHVQKNDSVVQYFYMKTLATHIAQCIEHLEIERNYAQTTIRNYQLYLTRFQKWASLHGIKTLEACTLKDIEKYREWLLQQGGKKRFNKNTFNYHLIALRSFLKYARKRSIKTVPLEKIFLAKTPPRKISALSSKEVESLLAAPFLSKEQDIIKKRDTAILTLLAHTGITVSELAGLKRNDVNKKQDSIVIQGRENKYRSARLSVQAKNALASYLGARTDLYAPLFIRHDRAFHPLSHKKDDSDLFLTPRSIQRLVQRYGKIAGIAKPITPHTLRHSFAVSLLTKGTDIESVRSLMGHANVLTTQVYTYITK